MSEVIYRCLFQDSAKTLPQQLIHIGQLNFHLNQPQSGKLDCHLGDRSLGIWLENLPQITLPTNNYPVAVVAPLFALQYAHARCCALLRLAEQQGLIKLTDPHFRAISYQLQFNSIQGDFLLVMPPARAVINQIIVVVDALGSNSQQNWLKLTTNLALAFLEFGDRNPLWGKENPHLIQANLSLIAVTQMLLQLLLIDKLLIAAMIEL